MGENVTLMGDVADEFDELVAYNEKGLELWIDDLIAQRDEDPSNWNSFKMYAGMVTASGLMSLQTFSKGFVDVGRLGNGVLQERSLMGAGKDALRLLNLAGGAGAAVGRVTKVLKSVQAAGTFNCVYVSAVNSARQTAQKLFITVPDLMRQSGVSMASLARVGGATGAEYESLIVLLRNMGVTVRRVMPSGTNLDEVVNYVRANQNGVLNFSVQWARGGAHEMVASFSRAAGFVLKDPMGRVYRSMSAFLNANPGTTLLQGPMMFIPNSLIITTAQTAAAAGGVAGLAQIALQVTPVVPVVAKDPETAAQVLAVREQFSLNPPPKTPKTASAPAPPGSLGYYEVKPGDWLSKIAKRPEYYGNMHKWPIIYDANLKTIGRDPNLIKPGQILLIPKIPSVSRKKQ